MVCSLACNSNTNSLLLSPRYAELSCRSGLGKTETHFLPSTLLNSSMRTKSLCTEDTRIETPSSTLGNKLLSTEKVELLNHLASDLTLTALCLLLRNLHTLLKMTITLCSSLTFMTTKDRALKDSKLSSTKLNVF
jgi:hypothetical protein